MRAAALKDACACMCPYRGDCGMLACTEVAGGAAPCETARDAPAVGVQNLHDMVCAALGCGERRGTEPLHLGSQLHGDIATAKTLRNSGTARLLKAAQLLQRRLRANCLRCGRRVVVARALNPSIHAWQHQLR